MNGVQSLDREGMILLAAVIGEAPATLMTLEQLRRGLCRATVSGSPDSFDAAVVQPYAFPTDATAFGSDADAIWHLLGTIEGWDCVDVARDLAAPLAESISAASGHPCQLFEEIFYVLERPVGSWPHPAVRQLTVADLPLMEAATEALSMGDWRFGSAAALIADGIVAGAVIDGALVAAGYTAARGERYSDVGIVTREDWRNRGLSTACAALACTDIQAVGQIPVWGTSIENIASQKVAAKLGFQEVSRRVYVCRA